MIGVIHPGFRLFPDASSSIAGSVDTLFLFVLGISVAITLLIAAVIVFCIVRFRRRRANERPAATITHNWMEIGWTAIPLAVAMVIFVWGGVLYARIERPPADAMEIHVIAKQWMWKIQQPNGRREINQLHIPINRPIKLVLTSQDVIHDFFIPDFRVKQDVLPDRYTTEWFEAIVPGEYYFFCAQYCGTGHARMFGTVVAMEPQAYQEWLAQGNNSEEDQRPEVLGERAFMQFSCYTCHGVRSPTLAGLYGSKVQLADGRTVIADDNYLRESILDPSAKIVAGYTPIMPSFKGLLSEEQVFDLIAYIKSLKATQNIEQTAPLIIPGQTELPATQTAPQAQETKP